MYHIIFGHIAYAKMFLLITRMLDHKNPKTESVFKKKNVGYLSRLGGQQHVADGLVGSNTWLMEPL